MEEYVKEKISKMTLEQKVAQLFIVTPEAILGETEAKTELTDMLSEAFTNYQVGGFIQMGSNIQTMQQITTFNKDLQGLNDIPLFIGVDEEGGLVARVCRRDRF